MYEKLLLAAGGGIIDRVQQSEQDNCAVIAIGLGGTGVDALRNLKQKLYNRVKPDDPNAVVPVYSHVKFLAVDTDKRDMVQKAKTSTETEDGALGELNLSSEFFDISYDKKISSLFQMMRSSLARDPVYREWLQFDKIDAAEADNGAGGIRQLGRFLLMQKAEQFVAKVQEMVHQAMTGLGSCPVDIHIFSGMGGGTGAGTFLDACYLVQRALRNEGVGNYKTMGYFFLPDVNLAKEGLSSETRTYIKSNGYASMQELDYCMNLEHNGDEWHQMYPGAIGEIRTAHPPVEWCHLVSATTSSGAVVPEAYRYSLNVVTDYVMDFLVRSDSANSFDLNSHFSNVTSNKAYIRKNAGACYDYLILGAASAVIPFKQVLTYLASGVFAGFEYVQNRVPTIEESRGFQQRIGFTFDQVLYRVRMGIDMSFPVPDVKPRDVQENERLVVTWFQSMFARVEGTLAKNLRDLSSVPPTYAPTIGGAVVGNSSLMANVLSELRVAMSSPAAGPAYAASLVRGTSGSDLLAACTGIREEARSRRDHAQFQLDDHLYFQQQQAQNAFRHANVLNIGRHFRNFVNQTRNLYLTQAEVLTYQTVMNLMDAVTEHVRRLANEFTDPFRKTMANLFTVFAANRAELEAFADKKNPYEMPLVSMNDLLPTLNATLNSLDVPSVARDFMGELLTEEGIKSWGPNGNESNMAHIVSQFFLNRFSVYSTRSLSEFLQDKYKTTDPIRLANNIYNDLLQVVNDNAAPLFWTEMGYNVNDACAIGYVTVPQLAAEVVDAAKMLAEAQANQKLTVRETTVRDRISILRCLIGVPMWGYKGVKQYELDSSPRPGKHLYEKAEYVEGVPQVESRDWNLLPSPTPKSVMTEQNNPLVLERAESAVSAYDRGIAGGVIQKTVTGFEVRVIASSFMTEFRSKFEVAKDKPNDEKLDAQAALRSMSENRVYEPGNTVLSTELRPGNEDIERVLCIDRLVNAPKIQELIESELAKCDEMAADIDALEPKVDKDLDEFRKALFTGVIRLDLPRVTYVNSEFGDETVLSKPQMERGGVPLYQAFLSFKQLDPEVRASIVEETSKIINMDKLPDEVTEACRALTEVLADKKGLVSVANVEFPREVSDVKALIKDVEDSLNLFVRHYYIKL